MLVFCDGQLMPFRTQDSKTSHNFCFPISHGKQGKSHSEWDSTRLEESSPDSIGNYPIISGKPIQRSFIIIIIIISYWY